MLFWYLMGIRGDAGARITLYSPSEGDSLGLQC